MRSTDMKAAKMFANLMFRSVLALWISVVWMNLVAQAQPVPAPPQQASILILGATAHLGNGDVIENSAIGFDQGRINYVGSADRVDRSAYKEVIDAKGKHVYPGFIAPNSTLGLMEIGAVRATLDNRETGDYTPNVRSVIAYNTDSEITPTVRSNGVLMGQIAPRGGVLSGSSCVVHFDAWNWEDAVIREVDGIHLNWPRMYGRTRRNPEQQGFSKNDSYDEELRTIRGYFEEAKAYALAKEHALTDLKMESMEGLFDGSLTLYVHANDVKQISEAVRFKREMGVQKMVIVGGYDAWLVADLLRDNNVSVMLRRVHELPVYSDDDVDLPFRLPKLLQDEGVLFCFENAGDMAEMNTRNLQFYAGTAIAYGLTYEQAVMALTLNTARILGIDKDLGSLEKGKVATLFISEGDALDMRTNNVTQAFIEGRRIDLDNRQKQLYRKYRTKYSR